LTAEHIAVAGKVHQVTAGGEIALTDIGLEVAARPKWPWRASAVR
jgi:hypothetical protein